MNKYEFKLLLIRETTAQTKRRDYELISMFKKEEIF